MNDQAEVMDLLDAAGRHGLTEHGLAAALALKHHIATDTAVLTGLLSGQLDARRIRPGTAEAPLNPDDFEFSPRDPSTRAADALP